MRKPDALEKAHQVEFALGTQREHHLFGREFFDADDEIGAQPAKCRRQAAPGGVGQNLEISE
jgi:hypothetical protein